MPVSGDFVEVMSLATAYSPVSNAAMEERQARLRSAQSQIEDWLFANASLLPSGLAFEVGHGGVMGGVSPIPWIRVFEPKSSPRPTAGPYLVYLFDATGDAVYLSLNQGTSFKDASGQVRSRPKKDKSVEAFAANGRALIADLESPFVQSGLPVIDLRCRFVSNSASSKKTAYNYERGNIFARAYRKSAMPTDAQLQADLIEALPILAILAGSDVDAIAADMSDKPSTSSSGAKVFLPSRMDSGRRRAVELRAMEAATQYFSEEGWKTEDVSGSASYDLRCTRSTGEEMHVEVKGLSGLPTQILLTHNEVRHSQDNNCCLFVLHGVTIAGNGTSAVASGGTAQVISPWRVEFEDPRLVATNYAYQL